ncbi:MAG: glycosyltransferase family 4 protein [Beijerinckiaceae bacterium]
MLTAKRLAFVGNSLPRRCGIATFTTDLHAAMSSRLPSVDTMIVAMNDRDRPYEYPPSVQLSIRDNAVGEYRRAAHALNALGVDAISLQHEFGIFGGQAGSHIHAFLDAVTAPVVTTLHTVLAQPSVLQRSTISRIAARSARIVVMAERGRELLETCYGVPTAKVDVIPHGIPDLAFTSPDEAKAQLGYAGRKVVLTFGLLAPSKGIEIMIDAMPHVLKTTPDAIYVILGATHPNLIRDEGEAYRERLQARIRCLGIEDNVVLLNQFVDQATLLRHISMCDVYVTPYLNEEQMTSGTLAYSFGLGKAVVSTPYWHARDLLAGGLGALVPFGDTHATAAAVAELLANDPMRNAMRRRAYRESRSMTWECVGRRYAQTITRAIAQQLPKPVKPPLLWPANTHLAAAS